MHCRAVCRDASELIPTPCDEIVYKGFSGSNNFVCCVVPLVQWNTLNSSVNNLLKVGSFPTAVVSKLSLSYGHMELGPNDHREDGHSVRDTSLID